MAGVREGDFTALCTSHPAVRQWMADALAYVFREVPGLGGVFTITASEGLTNCASHGNWQSCPHCKNRDYADIITEVNAVIEEGVHRGNPQAKVIVWDWGWRSRATGTHCPRRRADIVARLPKSVWLMSVSEWALPLDRGGVRTSVGEYSLSAVGPGPRATLHWKAAKDGGAEDRGQGAVEQLVGVGHRALPARDGSGGRALPQPGVGRRGWNDVELDYGRLSFAESGACRPISHRIPSPAAGEGQG